MGEAVNLPHRQDMESLQHGIPCAAVCSHTCLPPTLPTLLQPPATTNLPTILEWLFPLHTMSSKSIQIVACFTSLFLFYCWFVFHGVFSHSPTEGYLGCSQFGMITNMAARNAHHSLLWGLLPETSSPPEITVERMRKCIIKTHSPCPKPHKNFQEAKGFRDRIWAVFLHFYYSHASWGRGLWP